MTRCLILGVGLRGQAISDKDITDFEVLRDVAVASWQPFLAFYIWGAHWRHLKNTTKPYMCVGDAALFQITLTTCCSLLCSVADVRD